MVIGAGCSAFSPCCSSWQANESTLFSILEWLTIWGIQYYLFSKSRQPWHRKMALGTQQVLHPSVCITLSLPSVWARPRLCVCMCALSVWLSVCSAWLVCVCVSSFIYLSSLSDTSLKRSNWADTGAALTWWYLHLCCWPSWFQTSGQGSKCLWNHLFFGPISIFPLWILVVLVLSFHTPKDECVCVPTV